MKAILLLSFDYVDRKRPTYGVIARIEHLN